jgi:hypothetical protein
VEVVSNEAGTVRTLLPLEQAPLTSASEAIASATLISVMSFEAGKRGRPRPACSARRPHGSYPGSLYDLFERRGGPGRRRLRQRRIALIANAKTIRTITIAMATPRLLVFVNGLGGGLIVVHAE